MQNGAGQRRAGRLAPSPYRRRETAQPRQRFDIEIDAGRLHRASHRRDEIEIAADHLARHGAVGKRAPSERGSVREHVDREFRYVVRQHMIVTGEEGARLGGHGERERAARRGGIFDFRAILRREVLVTRRRDQSHDIVLHRWRKINPPRRHARRGDAVGAERGAEAWRIVRRLMFDEIENFSLGRRIGKSKLDMRHETIELRFRQSKSSFVLDRILRRDHHEWIGQPARYARGRHLTVRHRLEQRRLHLGRRAIDFIDKNR